MLRQFRAPELDVKMIVKPEIFTLLRVELIIVFLILLVQSIVFSKPSLLNKGIKVILGFKHLFRLFIKLQRKKLFVIVKAVGCGFWPRAILWPRLSVRVLFNPRHIISPIGMDTWLIV